MTRAMADSPLLRVLREPAAADSLNRLEWVDLLGSARHANLLSRLAWLLDDKSGRHPLPERARLQLRAAQPTAAHHERMIRWEVRRIADALGGLNTRIVLLKGAAYVMAGLPAAHGRLMTDVDILVPKKDIRGVEAALMANGWEAVKLHPYDQRFYREWAHELPPLKHATRRTVVDVHHNILPVSGRLHPDAERLLEGAVPLSGAGREAGAAPATPAGFWTLGPEDMVLHNAVHLFQDGDLAGSVRDLVDADSLLRDFGRRLPGFWDRLPIRAREHGLERPLFYTLRYVTRLLATPVPPGVMASIAAPPALVVTVMDRMVSRALLPMSGAHGTLGEESARTILYARSHWLRMPPWQLATHLARKAARRWSDDEADA